VEFGDGNESGSIAFGDGDFDECCGESTAAIVYSSTGWCKEVSKSFRSSPDSGWRMVCVGLRSSNGKGGAHAATEDY
jgi:hypothetical protein